MRFLLPLLLACIPATANAAKAVMEGIVATSQTIFVDTTNVRVGIATTTYGGAGVPNVGLIVSSNVVISNPTSGNNVVIYATGSVVASGVILGSGGGGGSSTQTVSWAFDNFIGQVTGSKAAFTLTQSPSSNNGVLVVLDGLLQSSASDYTLSGTALTMTTAPASNSSSFYATYTINTSTLPAAMLVNSTDTVSGAKTFLSTVTVGSQSYALALNYNAVIKGGWSIVASTRNYATNSATFTNFNPNYIHQVRYRCTIRSGTGSMGVRFGSSGGIDSGTNYGWHSFDVTSAGGTNSTNSNSDTSIHFRNSLSGSNAAQLDSGEFSIYTDTGAQTQAQLEGHAIGDDGTGGGGRARNDSFAGTYIGNGANRISQFLFFNTNNDNADCIVYILALLPGVDPP